MDRIKKFDRVVSLAIFPTCIVANYVASVMSLLHGIGSMNYWNTVIAVDVLVMVAILVGRFVYGIVRRMQSVKR